MRPNDAQSLRCSFCNKSSDEVRKIIAGRTACICDECIEVCEDIVADESSSRTTGIGYGAPTKPITRIRCALCGERKPYNDSVLALRQGALCATCVSDIGWALAEKGGGRR
jgi:NAD-dependent dihydropyrimidine dehydrogenase PreA subunit